MAFDIRPLKDICSHVVDCPHSTPFWTEAGFIVIRNQNIKNGRLDLSDPSYTDAEHFAHRTRRAKPAPGDIVFTREAPMGEVCMVPKGVECCLGQRQVLLRPDSKVIDGRYLLFALQSPRVQNEISWSEGTGSTVSNVRIPVLEALKIPVPPLSVQKEIGDILGSIDDQIELLRDTNTTLEAIAQAIFKSWFIDFDPVKAKSEGRTPDGIDADTAALFPDSFEESALGAIPKGWTIDEVGNVADCVGGGTPSTKEEAYWEPGTHHWVTPKDLSGLGSPVLLDTERKLSPLGIQKVSSGLLPKGTLLLSSRAPIGYLALAQIPLAVNQGFIAMKPGGRLPPEYLYFWTASAMAEIKQKANGSTFMEISKSAFRPIKLVVPEARIVQAFQNIVGTIFEAIEANESERRTLTELRDTLLPRLISGKLKLPELQEVAEAL